MTQRIVDARKKLKTVGIPYEFRVKISAICSELNVDGIRGDIVTNRAAKALAAFEGRDEVAVEDIYRWVCGCWWVGVGEMGGWLQPVVAAWHTSKVRPVPHDSSSTAQHITSLCVCVWRQQQQPG